MLRPVLTEVVLFLAPFVLYALFILATQRSGVFDRANWPAGRVLILGMVACLCVIVSFVVLAHWGGAPRNSNYVPAHIDKDGNFIPGGAK